MLENLIRWVGAVTGLATLAVALWQGVWRGLRRNQGSTVVQGGRLLRAPILLVFGLLWLAICVILWRPIPVALSPFAGISSLITGVLLYFLGQVLYLWGGRTLGSMYRPSSALGGAQIKTGDRLVTHGPFAFVRHPLYLGLQMAAIGGLLLYRNWTFAFIAVNFAFLFLRARREEQALAEKFGAAWEQYASRVPAWLPRFCRRDDQP